MTDKPVEEEPKGQRLVRATVNLHELPAQSQTWIDWPPAAYVARMLKVGYLVLVDPPPKDAE